MAKTQIWPEKIGIHDALVNARKNEIGGLIDVAVPTLMNLMTPDVIQFENRVASGLVLDPRTILIG